MKNAYLASLSLSLISCYNLGAKVLADGPADAGSTGGSLATGGSSAQVGGASNNGGVAGYNSGVQGGAPTVGGSFATGGNSGVDPGGCLQPSLVGAPTLFVGCSNGSGASMCPHSFQLNIPDYGPFTACCPPGYPYSCANGTPNSCFATAAAAQASCGSNCVACSDGIVSTVDARTVITLKRDYCFGMCPVYSLTIGGDGTVTYQGTQYVNVVGTATSQIAVSDVQSLVDQMMQADYFNLSVPATCPQGMWTDMPTSTTSLTLDNQSHSIVYDHGNQCAPAILSTLENRIDEISNSAQWVKCDTANGICAN